MSVNMSAYRWFGRGWLSAGYVFLYIPILVLIGAPIVTNLAALFAK